MSSTAPDKTLPCSSLHRIPLVLFLQIFKSSVSLNNFRPLVCSLFLISGGSSPFSLNLSKCFFNMLSIPLGSEGKIPSGLCQTLCLSSQKHLGHSFIKFRDEGESLYKAIGIFENQTIKRLIWWFVAINIFSS